jgi:DNA-binding response OmpR family regulator
VFLVRRALKKHDLDVKLVVVEDGRAALQYMDKIDQAGTADLCPDLVLLDLNLPRAPGSRVLTRIRQSPQCSATPIIIVTSSDSPFDREKAVQLGATDYFQKPGDLAGFMELGLIVRNALDRCAETSQQVWGNQGAG